MVGLLVAASIGLGGGGPDWLRYVGSGTLFLFLMLILTQVSQLPTKVEYKAMIDQLQVDEEDMPGAPQISAMPPGGMPPGMGMPPGGIN